QDATPFPKDAYPLFLASFETTSAARDKSAWVWAISCSVGLVAWFLYKDRTNHPTAPQSTAVQKACNCASAFHSCQTFPPLDFSSPAVEAARSSEEIAARRQGQ